MGSPGKPRPIFRSGLTLKLLGCLCNCRIGIGAAGAVTAVGAGSDGAPGQALTHPGRR
jgi:hypothetical protein